MYIIKKIGAVIILGISIFSFIGCNNSPSNKEISSGVNNKDISSDINNENVSDTKLDKSNAVIIEYNNDDYSKSSNMIAHDKLNAQETYLNKTIKVTGEISEMTPKGDKIVVVLTSPNKLGAVYVEFDSSYKDKLLNLNIYNKRDKKDGDIITVYGYCSQFDNICVFLSNCEFE